MVGPTVPPYPPCFLNLVMCACKKKIEHDLNLLLVCMFDSPRKSFHKMISWDKFSKTYDSEKKQIENEIKKELQECMEAINEGLQEEAKILAHEGLPKQNITLNFELENFAITNPSYKLDILVKMITESKEWNVEILKQQVGELGLPSEIDLKPVLRITRATRPSSPFRSGDKG